MQLPGHSTAGGVERISKRWTPGAAALICLENEAGCRECRGQSGSELCAYMGNSFCASLAAVGECISQSLSYSALCEMSFFRRICLKMGLFTPKFLRNGSRIWDHSLHQAISRRSQGSIEESDPTGLVCVCFFLGAPG